MDITIWLTLAIAGFSVLAIFGLLLTGHSNATASGGDADGASSVMVHTGARRFRANKEEPKNGEQTRSRLIRAGLYQNSSLMFFYASQIMFVLIPLAIGVFAYGMGLMTQKVAILVALTTSVAGVLLPGLFLDYLKRRRQTTIRRALPDALDVITVCVEAGLSLSASIVRVANELSAAHPLLGMEMTIVHREIQMGKTAGTALRSFGDRFDLEEIRSLSSVIQQSERYGASIAPALRVHGDSLRERRMQSAHERAQKAAVKLLFPTVICIFPALLVVVLGPAAFDIWNLFQSLK